MKTYNSQNNSQGLDEREKIFDLYETHPGITEALLNQTPLFNFLPDRPIWEPCAGRGAIADVFKKHGREVYCSDIKDWGYDGLNEVKDFFAYDKPPVEKPIVVTNPPFMRGYPQEMALKCLSWGLDVIFLLRLAFLEGKSPGRRILMDNGFLNTVYLFADRVPKMHRENYDGKKSGNVVAYAWFHWHPSVVDGKVCGYNIPMFKRIWYNQPKRLILND